MEILSNPGILALILAVIPGGFVLIQYILKRGETHKTSKLSLDEQKTRLLWWYQEGYHKARRAIIDLGGDPVEMGLPFEPQRSLLHSIQDDKD